MVILITGLILSACTGSAASPPASRAPSVAPASTAPASAAGQGLLGEILDRGVIRVANSQTQPPWNYLDANNQPVGYDVDVANEIARRIGIPKVAFVQGTFKTFIEGIKADKWDIVITGLTVTDERREQVDFSCPYQINGVSIFVNDAETAISGEPDLEGKRIAVTAGTTNETYARESIPGSAVQTYENTTLALTDVGIGRADAYLGSRFVGAYLAKENGLKAKPLPGFLSSEINAMAFRKGEVALGAAVNGALADMIADGTLTALSKKWLQGEDMAGQLSQADLPDC
jgi:cystine transport system substrate-binding protein